jgi:hypothetical protein
VRNDGKEMVYVGIGDGLGQSEPWDLEGKWSRVSANRKQLFLGAAERKARRRERGRAAVLRDQK